MISPEAKWRLVESRLRERLAECQGLLERSTCDWPKVLETRAQIKLIRELLELGETPVPNERP